MASGDSSPWLGMNPGHTVIENHTRRWIAGRDKSGPYGGWGVQWWV